MEASGVYAIERLEKFDGLQWTRVLTKRILKTDRIW
jgi:hypothetical protein